MTIDLSALLQPITESAPCGEDYSFSQEFHNIKKARIEENSLLDQGDWVSERKQADWNYVVQTSTTLLESKTKDIRLLNWLTEGWANVYGFEGVSKGLELTHQILNLFWLPLHPEIEDDDLDQRIGLLQGFINQLVPLIKKTPIVSGSPFYNLFDYEQFLNHENLKRKQPEDYTSFSSDDNSPSEMEEFESALKATSQNFQQQNYEQFKEILTQWETTKTVLDDLLGYDSPSFATIDSNLEDIEIALKKLYKVNDAVATNASNAEAVQSLENPDAVATQTQQPIQQIGFHVQAQNHLENREQALKMLKDISDYFETNEPHSPVSYMLQKTIKWSQMPLHEWLAEVIKDDQPLNMVQEMLGVAPKNEY